MKKRKYELFSEYITPFLGIVVSLLLLGMITKTYTWIKTYGDFATKTFVLEAQAECTEKAENDLHRHEDWESKQLERIEGKVDKLLLMQQPNN